MWLYERCGCMSGVARPLTACEQVFVRSCSFFALAVCVRVRIWVAVISLHSYFACSRADNAFFTLRRFCFEMLCL